MEGVSLRSGRKGVKKLDEDRTPLPPGHPLYPLSVAIPPRTSPTLRRALTDVGDFSALVAPEYRLRPYQLLAAQAIVSSVLGREGRQLAVVFSRQAGKDEVLAQVIAFLLVRHARRGGNIVVGAPTFRPQAALSRDRLLARLRASPLTAGLTATQEGYVVQVGRASARFLSAGPGAKGSARGQTADLLLVANEAQDIDPDVWDAVFDPMAASTNATTLFLGTVWSRHTLLARQMRFLREVEARERGAGPQRLWLTPWEEVAAALPAYGARVRARIAQLGPTHPFIRTEYCLEELDGDGGLFPPHRLAQMAGDHPRRHHAEPGKRYALLLDVAGEEEAGTGPLAFDDASRRDSTALTVVEVDTTGERPVYRVVDRRAWTGVRHTALHATLIDLARVVWRASWVVVDATGVGAGLASFLAAALGRGASGLGITVVPFVFTSASKSALGWDFLGLIDSGRFKEYRSDADEPSEAGRLTRIYHQQLAATTYETLPGPGNRLRWSVPAGQGHDDLVVSAALTAVLDGLDLRRRIATGVATRA